MSGIDITDDMCRRAVDAMKPDRIQGFSTQKDSEWGRPHWILDVYRPPGQQEIWRGDSHADMIERCEMEKMRLALSAALASR